MSNPNQDLSPNDKGGRGERAWERSCGLYFKWLIERDWKKGGSKLFIQDGDPSQNSAIAHAAWKSIGAKMMPIPPRSRDINCIGNYY